VDLDKILCGGDEAEDDLNAIVSNTVASTTPKGQTFKFVMWVLRNPSITFELIGGFG
jgi:hypothetical protein